MQYEVRLKAGHPTGIFRRDGKVFTTKAPVRLNKISDAIANDPMLEVTEVLSDKEKADRAKAIKDQKRADDLKRLEEQKNPDPAKQPAGQQ